jgi:hypothetical protein
MKLNKIHEDERGEIYTITGEEMNTPEITLLRTNNGFARGGCIHELRDEFCVCVEGLVEHYLEGTDPDQQLPIAPQHKEGFKLTNLHKGKPVLIPHGTPHYFYSKTDSVVLEFGAKIDETTKHPETRDFIDQINKKVGE